MNLYLKTKDYSVSQEEFMLMYDEDKDMLVTQPKPSNIETYYDSPDYISHTDATQTFFDRVYQKVKRFNLKRKMRLIETGTGNKKSLLDVGSGTGDFLVMAKASGWQAYGVEPNSKAQQRTKEKGVVAYQSLEHVPNQNFQVITLWHVLEHFSDLESSIRKLTSLLEENGTLIIAVPNFKSCDAHYYNIHWAGFDVPRHLWHFSKKSIELLFSDSGCQIISTKPMWFDAFYVSILSERYKGSRASFIKGLVIGAYSNLRALFTGEYSSRIYVLKKQQKDA